SSTTRGASPRASSPPSRARPASSRPSCPAPPPTGRSSTRAARPSAPKPGRTAPTASSWAGPISSWTGSARSTGSSSSTPPRGAPGARSPTSRWAIAWPSSPTTYARASTCPTCCMRPGAAASYGKSPWPPGAPAGNFPPSAPDRVHRPLGLEEAGFVHRVALPLGPNRVADGRGQRLVAGSLPQQPPQVELLDGEQAVADLAVRGEADAVALAAEGAA